MNSKRKEINISILSIVLCVGLIISLVISGLDGKVTTIEIEDESVPLSGNGVLVEQTIYDINVIPDKYNTGCSGELIKADAAQLENGVRFRIGDGSVVLEFAYYNSDISGDVIIENIDFSDSTFTILHEDKVTRDIHVIFNNCKFGKIKNSRSPGSITYEYNNCSIIQFFGSGSTFNRCQFGHSYNDGLIPFQNITVNDSYFCDLASTDPTGAGKHSDGTQMYAYTGIPVKNVSYNRCRMEIPAIQSESKDAASVNACFMVQLEYDSAYSVHFNDCIINGGGYSIYACACKNPNNKLNDVLFNNITVGSAHLFGVVHPNISEGASFVNVHDQDSLYVSSVWKDEAGTHIVVSNDTEISRTLKIITDKQEYSYTIGRCLGGKELRYSNFDIPFSSFPFDREIIIEDQLDYIICYDATNEDKQIRFVNWSGENVYRSGAGLDNEESDSDVSDNDDYDEAEKTENNLEDSSKEIIAEGSCGANSVYRLDGDGILHISGEGSMDSYSKLAPWADYAKDIVAVYVEAGITGVGSQTFRKLENLETVYLAETVEEIGAEAFYGCSSLKSIEMFGGIKVIEKRAFDSTGLVECIFHGTEDAWNSVKIGKRNDDLLQCSLLFISETDDSEEDTLLDEIKENSTIFSGECGTLAQFEFSEDGTLHIWGEGDIYSFNSENLPPWSDYIEEVKIVIIDEGISSIGSMSFRKASGLSVVSLPNTLKNIGGNAFAGCSSLSEIELPSGVEYIGKAAFANCGLTVVHYAGSDEQWLGVSVEERNEALTECLDCVQ